MSAFDRVLPQLWMLVPSDERSELVAAFNLSRTGISEIRDEELISDGYCADDLAAITKERMEEFVGSKEDSFGRLWELTCAKARFLANPPMEIKMPGGVVLREATPEEAEAMIAAEEPVTKKKAKAGDHGTA